MTLQKKLERCVIMSINVKEARALVARCIETLDDNKTVEDGDVDTLCNVINQMCEYIEKSNQPILNKLTESEDKIMELLQDAYIGFLGLPESYAKEESDFVNGINIAMNVILARLAKRVLNEQS